jgi:5-methylcytosine-specific restriction endonuclease McrA
VAVRRGGWPPRGCGARTWARVAPSHPSASATTSTPATSALLMLRMHHHRPRRRGRAAWRRTHRGSGRSSPRSTRRAQQEEEQRLCLSCDRVKQIIHAVPRRAAQHGHSPHDIAIILSAGEASGGGGTGAPEPPWRLCSPSALRRRSSPAGPQLKVLSKSKNDMMMR